MGVWVTLLALSWALTLARCCYLRSTDLDRAANAVRVCQTLGCTLISPLVEHVLPQAWTVQCGVMSVAVAMQMVGKISVRIAPQPTSWQRPADNLTRLPVGATAVALLILGYPAWSRGHTPFDQPSPAMLGYWLLYAIPAWLYIYLTLASLRAEPRGGFTRTQRASYALAVVTSVVPLTITVLLVVNAVLLAAGDRTRLAGWAFVAYRYYTLYMTVAHSVLYTVPLQQRVAQALGLDRWSRQRRQLTPLWSDLTAACPETVHLAPPTPVTADPRYRLHRTIVEIRDSMLILARHTTSLPTELADTLAADAQHDDTLRRAVQLARAAAAKTHGETPRDSLAVQRSTANDLLTDADELTRIARIWPHAKSLVTLHITHPGLDRRQI